jgi:hypothetical protein
LISPSENACPDAIAVNCDPWTLNTCTLADAVNVIFAVASGGAEGHGFVLRRARIESGLPARAAAAQVFQFCGRAIFVPAAGVVGAVEPLAADAPAVAQGPLLDHL